jgi:hypothetical protein
LKLPDLVIKDLGEAGGVQPALGNAPGVSEGSESLRLASAVANADAKATKSMELEAHEAGGVPSAVKAIPAPTEDTASVELASVAKGAATVKPEALEPWAGDEAGHECDMAQDEGSTAGACGTDTAPRDSVTVGEQAPEPLLHEAMAVDGRKHGLETLSQEGLPPSGRMHNTAPHKSLIDGERTCDMAPQYSSAGSKRTCEAALLLEAATMDAAKQVLEALLPQGDMAERTPKALPEGSLTEGMMGRDRDAL